MARRRTRSCERPDVEPFNNPFTGALSGMRSRLPASGGNKAPQTAAQLEPAYPSPPATSGNVRDASPKESRDESRGILAAELEGVVELDHSGDRVPRPAPRDDSRTGNRQREGLGKMDSLVHFDIRHSEQYIRGCAAGVSQKTLRKLERGEFAVRAHLDLHGLVVEDAERAVDQFLSGAQRRGARCVLVVTGKGYNSVGRSGVLREKIPQWLVEGPSSRRVLAFVTARPCDGGEGALYVLLRRRCLMRSPLVHV